MSKKLYAFDDGVASHKASKTDLKISTITGISITTAKAVKSGLTTKILSSNMSRLLLNLYFGSKYLYSRSSFASVGLISFESAESKRRVLILARPRSLRY